MLLFNFDSWLMHFILEKKGKRPSMILNEVDVPIINDYSCAKAYPGLIDRKQHLCAGAWIYGGKDSCYVRTCAFIVLTLISIDADGSSPFFLNSSLSTKCLSLSFSYIGYI